MFKLCCFITIYSTVQLQPKHFLNQKVMDLKNCKYLVIFIFKLFVALKGKWKKLFRFLQLLRAKLFPSPYIYEQTCSFSLQNYEQTCSLSLQIYEQGVQEYFQGAYFSLLEPPMKKSTIRNVLVFAPSFTPLNIVFQYCSPLKLNCCSN